MHHDVDQEWVQWCSERELVDSVTCFVFVSYWQRERYLNAFGLPPERCAVLRHALDLTPERRWEPGPILRCAYTSTPFRGLSVLLDAWERLNLANAELHIWSSMKLYLGDDSPYEHLYARANSLRGVTYHGLSPNPELRRWLRAMHFLVYPCTFAETACLAAIEAMAAGCRLIVPSLGALPETTSGYARVYPFNPDPQEHVITFCENLAAELENPWADQPGLSLQQQSHCASVYNWPGRLREWRQLIGWACNQTKRTKVGSHG
jgi:glycosyltransferase involved in cell wall biosynthesis